MCLRVVPGVVVFTVLYSKDCSSFGYDQRILETHQSYINPFLPFNIPRASVAVPIPKAIMNVQDLLMMPCVRCARQDVAKMATKIILTAFDGR